MDRSKPAALCEAQIKNAALQLCARGRACALSQRGVLFLRVSVRRKEGGRWKLSYNDDLDNGREEAGDDTIQHTLQYILRASLLLIALVKT